MDVLDDLIGECGEVTGVNPWLTYGEPLHRMREFGITLKEMDMMDEAKLSSEQMRTLVSCLLGGKKNDYPRPEMEWEAFEAEVRTRNAQTGTIWCPKTCQMKDWIRETQLAKCYGPKKSSCAIS